MAKSKFNKVQKSESGNLSPSPSRSRSMSFTQEGEGLIQKIISQVDSVKNLKDLMNSDIHSSHSFSSPNNHHPSTHLSPHSLSTPSFSHAITSQTPLDIELNKYFQLPESERVFEGHSSYCYYNYRLFLTKQQLVIVH